LTRQAFVRERRRNKGSQLFPLNEFVKLQAWGEKPAMLKEKGISGPQRKRARQAVKGGLSEAVPPDERPQRKEVWHDSLF
jgi:hypothetical protein